MTSTSNWNQLFKWDRMASAGACLGCLKYPSEQCATCSGTGVVKRRQTVFVASLADVFEEWDGPIYARNRKLFPDDTPLWFQRSGDFSTTLEQSLAEKITGSRPVTYDDVRERLWSYIDRCPNLIFLVLTKRPENILRMTEGRYFPNVMFGTSIEDQFYAHERLPHLHAARARCGLGLFVSCEPLLGPVDLGFYLAHIGLHWVIVGGESGAGARPCDIEWVRDIVRKCRAAGVAPFVKQLGSKPAMPLADWRAILPGRVSLLPTLGDYSKLRLKHGHGGNTEEWPEDMRVREFPVVAP